MTRDDIIRMAREAGIVVTGEAVWKLCELVAQHERIQLLYEQLNEAEKQEPVAWMVYTQDGQSAYVTDIPNIQKNQRALPLYTTPPQRQPLTEEEITAIATMIRARGNA